MVGCPPADAERSAARAWLVHPVTVLALVVLVANDHVLKARIPGLVTGKLSDVAGLVVTPPLLAVVVVVLVGPLRARAVAFAAIAATGVGFAAVKAFPAIALIASGVWSAANGPSIIIADRSDLIALPALGVAAWVSTHSGQPKRFGVGHADRPPRPAEPSGRTPRALGQRLHRLAVFIVLPMAALALVATSAPDYPDAVAVGTWRGMAVIGERNAYHVSDPRPDTWQVSEDGARTWRHLAPDEADAWTADERSTLSLEAQSACAPAVAARCYRV
jgi:hypothetical protein